MYRVHGQQRNQLRGICASRHHLLKLSAIGQTCEEYEFQHWALEPWIAQAAWPSGYGGYQTCTVHHLNKSSEGQHLSR